MKWTEAKVYVNPEAIEAVSFMLYESSIHGIEVVDNTLSEQDMKDMMIDYLGEKVVDPNAETYIKFYLSEQENIPERIEEIKVKLEELRQHVDLGKGTIDTSITDEEDWANNWKKYYKPFRIDGNIVIKPTWEKYEKLVEDDIIIDIDPGMAFGSGTHETTSMCISLINKYINEEDKVIDVGCGSGILGITAAKLSAKEVVCIDLDKNAVKVAKENAQINDVENIVKTYHGDLLAITDLKANMIVANIIADVIVILAENVGKHLLENGVFISSGIILDRIDDVVDALTKNNMEVIEIRRMGEWAAIVAKPK